MLCTELDMSVVPDASTLITWVCQAYKLCTSTLSLQDLMLSVHVVGDHA